MNDINNCPTCSCPLEEYEDFETGLTLYHCPSCDKNWYIMDGDEYLDER